MRTLSRQVWPVLVFAAAAVAVACWRGSPDGGAGRALGPGRITHEEYSWDEEYESQRRYLAWSYPVRLRTGQALRRGDLTLWEAAACFGQVEALRPPRLRANSEFHRGATLEERLCRHVIEYVRVALEEEREDDRLIQRLEAELDERVRRGDLRLPAPPSDLVGPPGPGAAEAGGAGE
jgi:hypothetical protein